jgi:hypothetical protein
MKRFALLLLAGCGMTTTPDGPSGGVTASFASLYGDYFSHCSQCHTPTAPGRTSDIEMNLDFTTKATAFTSITSKMASVPPGNFTGCNGVAFVMSGTPAKSLIVAVVDEGTRQSFDVGTCGRDDIPDETLMVGSAPSAAFVTALKDWISAGAPNN